MESKQQDTIITDKGEVKISDGSSLQSSKKLTMEQASQKAPDQALTSEQSYRLDMLMKEIAKPEFSEDPYIEVTLQSNQLMYCEMFTRGYLRTELEGKIKNKAWDEQYKAHCEAKRKQHPHLLVSTFTGKALDWVPATSSWGKSLKVLKAIPFTELRHEGKNLIRLSLRNKNAFMLSLSLVYSGSDHTFNYNQWLGTNNKKYQDRVTQLAFNHLTCEWDPEGLCGPSSIIMAESCWQTPKDCGMPFLEWFEKNHMPGFKKDVALVLAKLKAYADGVDVE